MPINDAKFDENVQKIAVKVAEIVMKRLQTDVTQLIEDTIQAQIEPTRKQVKIQLDSMFSTIETLSKAHDFALKEINYKIGAISGKQTKAKSQETLTFENMQDAKSYMEFLDSKGLIDKTTHKDAKTSEAHSSFRSKLEEQRANIS